MSLKSNPSLYYSLAFFMSIILETIFYYTLRSSLQILRSVVLDDGTSRAGDLTSGSVLSRGSIISKRPHVFECIHVTYALKHNTRMIRLYRTGTVSKDLNNANSVTLIVKLYSVTMNKRYNVSSFDRIPRSMCGQVSNNEHVTSHHLTRLNVEFADLIATCNSKRLF